MPCIVDLLLCKINNLTFNKPAESLNLEIAEELQVAKLNTMRVHRIEQCERLDKTMDFCRVTYRWITCHFQTNAA